MSFIINPYSFGSPSFPNTYSLDFDGVNDYIDVGVYSGIVGTDTFSISMWVKMPSGGGGYVAAIGNLSSHWAMNFQYYISEGTIEVFNTSNLAFRNTGLSLATDTWMSVIMVQDRGEAVQLDRCKIYINGSIITNVTNSNFAQVPSASPGPLTIGVRQLGTTTPGTLSAPFEGNIDEVSIWSNALTSGEANTIGGGGAPTDLTGETGLISWWRMGDFGTFFNGNWEIPEQTKIDNWSSHSMEFDGVDAWIDISGATSEIAGTPRGTLSAWVRPAVAVPATNDRILHFGASGSSAYIAFYCDTFGRLKADCRDSTGTYQWRCRTPTAPFTAGEWIYITLVHNGVTPALYVNGVGMLLYFIVSTDKTVWFDSLGIAVDEAAIGADLITNPASLFYEGNIDEVSIFSRVKIPSVLWNNGTPPDLSAQSGLEAYYRMGEDATFSTPGVPGGFWTIPDDSFNSNDGTSENMDEEDKVNNAPDNINQGLSSGMIEGDRKLDTPP